jgi:hypothetical protein
MAPPTGKSFAEPLHPLSWPLLGVSFRILQHTSSHTHHEAKPKPSELPYISLALESRRMYRVRNIHALAFSPDQLDLNPAQPDPARAL